MTEPTEQSLDQEIRKPSKPSQGKFAAYRRAAKESKDRNAGTSDIWGRIWAIRDAFDGYGRFRLPLNTTTDTVLLDDGYPVLAHKISYGWKKGIKPFPRKEDVRCTAWMLDEEGRWKRTGKNCPLCTILGKDPRLVVLWPLLDSREELLRKTNETKKWTLKWMALDNDVIRGNIWDGVEIYAEENNTDATTKFSMFRVSRGSDEKSNAYGTGWTFIKYASSNTKEVKAALEKLPSWEDSWPLLSEVELLQIAKRHREICDRHVNGSGYDHTGAAVLFDGAPAEDNSIDDLPPISPPSKDNEPSLDTPKEDPVPDQKPPRLQDLDDLDEDPPKTPEEGGADDEGFDPWKDGKL